MSVPFSSLLSSLRLTNTIDLSVFRRLHLCLSEWRHLHGSQYLHVYCGSQWCSMSELYVYEIRSRSLILCSCVSRCSLLFVDLSEQWNVHGSQYLHLYSIMVRCHLHHTYVTHLLSFAFDPYFCSLLAVCSSACQNGGTCTAPNTCACVSGWTGATCGSCLFNTPFG